MTKLKGKFIKSGFFKNKSEKFLHALTGDYKLKLEYFNGERKKKKQNTVIVDPDNKILEDLNEIQQVIGLRGLVSQKSFHRLYTDYKQMKNLKNYNIKDAYYQHHKELLEILEDKSVEIGGLFNFPGLKQHNKLINDKNNALMGSEQSVESEVSKVVAFKNAIWKKINNYPVENFKDATLQKVYDSSLEILEKSKYSKNTKERLKLSEELFDLSFELLKEALDNDQETSMNNEKGDDLENESKTEGEEIPKEALEKEKSKKDKKDKKDGEKEESDQDGEKSDETEDGEDSDQDGEGEESDQDGEKSEKDGDGEGEESDQDSEQDSDSKSSDKESKSKSKSKKQEQKDVDNSENGSEEAAEDFEDEASQDDLDQLEKEEMEHLMKEIEEELKEMKEEYSKSSEDDSKHQEKIKKIESENKSFTYKERHSRMKIQTITEFSKNPDSYNRLHDRIKTYSRNLAKKIENLLKYNMEEKRTGETNGYLDMSSLFRKDGRVFSLKKDKDDESELAILLLVDESGSMGGERAQAARDAAILVAEVCQKLNIPLAIVGHTASFRSDKVEMRHFISFEAPIEAQKHNLVNITARQDNRDGMALKYSGEYLAKQPQKDKLMLVIADGEPAHSVDHYYGSSAIKDCVDVIKEMEKKGIVSVGIAIGDGQDGIQEIFKNFISINKLELLPQKLVKIIEKRVFK